MKRKSQWKFDLGQMVIVKIEPVWAGTIGKVISRSSALQRYCVRFAADNESEWFAENELASAPPATKPEGT